MNTAKIYKDSDGNDCTINQMVKYEPDWVASRFQHMESQIEKMNKRFDFGDGHVFIGNIEQDGVNGLVISHSEEKHSVDDKNPEWGDKKTPYVPKEDDVLLMATSREGARVLQNMVNALCLIMDGFEIEDSPQVSTLQGD